MSAVEPTHAWLRHPETGGYFNCPTTALKDWLGMGWERSDPPEEPNPVVAERIAWEREQSELASANATEPDSAAEPDTDTTSTEAAVSGESEEG